MGGHSRAGIALILSVLCLGSTWAQEKAPVEYAWEDPTKIKTAEICQSCHASEYDVWFKTTHARGFKTLHRKKAAETIAEKMGFHLIKRESLCLTCHYTPIIKNDTLRAVSGVSCESCHGAAADWIDIHNNYGGKGFTWENETPEHKRQRIEQSRELGMRRPSDMYAVAARCFQCHTVPDERLVNVGGHGTGSSDFEYVTWSQGEMRHNFYQSFLTGDGTVNAERSATRKRVMYVLGRALDVEYSLRGLAVAKEKKRYFKAMSRRLRTAGSEVRAIQATVEIPELVEILALVKQAKKVPGNETDLLVQADRIGEWIKLFLDRSDGSELVALDPLVRGESPPPPERPVAEPTPATASSAAPATGAGSDPSTTPPTSEGATAAVTPPAKTGAGTTKPPSSAKAAAKRPAVQAVVGAFKTHIRPKATFESIGPGKCGSCHRHETQSTWWFEDAHYASADPFLEQNPENVALARRYGLSADDMAKGTAVCMDCHGTVVTGKEHREVSDGVGCEGCHGPAASYLKPHQKGERELGVKRPGYVDALKLGMLELRDASVRAKTCADCHYITDERLLSAGHKSGADFDYIEGMKQISHWEREVTLSVQAMTKAFAAELSARGPVPKVRLATEVVDRQPEATAPASAQATPAASAKPTTRSKSRTTSTSQSKPKAVRPQVPAPRPVDPISVPDPEAVNPVSLPPFPEIDESMPIEDVLLLLKQRLELLNQIVREKSEKRP